MDFVRKVGGRASVGGWRSFFIVVKIERFINLFSFLWVMELTELIDTYCRKLATDRRDATMFVLHEMQEGPSQRVLNRRYVLLFGLGEEGDAYDPVKGEIYAVDPEMNQLNFEIRQEEATLFRRDGKVQDERCTGLVAAGKKSFVQGLESLYGLKMRAHIFDPELQLAADLKASPDYARTIAAVDIMKLQARSYAG